MSKPQNTRAIARQAKVGDTFKIRCEELQRYRSAFNDVGWSTSAKWIGADTIELSVVAFIDERNKQTGRAKYLRHLAKLTAKQLEALVNAAEQNGMFK